MPLLSRLKRPPWRTFVLLAAVLGFFGLVYFLWSPGKSVKDGRNDRGTNALWLQHGWLGHDDWFERYGRDRTRFRDAGKIAEFARKLRAERIRWVYPHLCPCLADGRIAKVDDTQVELFLNEMEGIEVVPWVGGVLDVDCSPENPVWRVVFMETIASLLERHPRLAGVQVNIEPMPSGNPHFLTLLEELRGRLPPGKMLLVAAYPPPSRWHPFPDVHWEEDYFREVASRCDQVAVMMYDTSIRIPKLYEAVMARWTREVLAWSGDTQVLLGLPAYDDADSGYHDPSSENLKHALRGVHAGLEKHREAPNYAGVAIYSEWEMDEQDWDVYRKLFRDPASR